MSQRRDLDGLAVRTRIGEMLPAMFHDDDLSQRWCDGLDDVIAPVPATLDNLWAYLDPTLAPLDFVMWLAGWVGLPIDQTWSEQRRRELVARAHRLYDYRGTAGGLADLIELFSGARPEIRDGGGVVWSPTPDAPMPGAADAELVVRLEVDDPDSVDESRLENMVEMNKPAHVVHRIEIVGGKPATSKASKKTSAKETSTPPPPPPPTASESESGTNDAEEPEITDEQQLRPPHDDPPATGPDSEPGDE